MLTAGVGQFHQCQLCRVPSFSVPTTACSPVCRRAAAALLVGFRAHWTESDGMRPTIGGKGFKGSELPAKASNVCSIQRHTMLSNIATSSQAEMIESYKNRTGDDFKRDSGSLLASGQDTFSLTSFVSSIWLSYFLWPWIIYEVSIPPIQVVFCFYHLKLLPNLNLNFSAVGFFTFAI